MSRTANRVIGLGSVVPCDYSLLTLVRRVLPAWREPVVIEVPASAAGLDETRGPRRRIVAERVGRDRPLRGDPRSTEGDRVGRLQGRAWWCWLEEWQSHVVLTWQMLLS